MSSVKTFFSKDQIKQIEDCIKSAEENTSGEIRVHIEDYCKQDPSDRAKRIFEKLRMTKTELHNGVLFYLAVRDRKFAVVGDVGIHKNVPENFWNMVRDRVLEKFREEKYIDGLMYGITIAGTELKKYFSVSSADKNELSNEVTFGKK